MSSPGDYEWLRREYERPDLPYRCGREAWWGKPCRQGPGPDGSCGGTRECRPARKGGAWECRRPASEGGACREGPNPDGSCARAQPPCSPRPTLRTARGRLAWLASGLVVAWIAARLPLGGGGAARASSVSPGPVSRTHEGFVAERGCAACHQGHGRGLRAWLQAAAAPADLSASCASCHGFDGPADAAHNHAFPGGPGAATRCTLCHREHHEGAPAARLSDAQCQSCHQREFASFARGHPAFPPDFPRGRSQPVRFDHAAHLSRHFKDPARRGLAPRVCSGCHDLRTAGRELRPVSFERACSACHAGAIRNELVLLRLPEKGAAALGEDETTPAERFLLRVGTDDPKGLAAAAAALFEEAAARGPAAIAARLDGAAGRPVGAALLAGLSPDTASGAAKAWREGKAPSVSEGAPMGGWYWGEDLLPELRYKPVGHGDPVVAAWLELSVEAARPGGALDPAGRARARRLRDRLLDEDEGSGGCMKCHAQTAGPDGAPRLAWRYRAAEERPLSRFSHEPHLPLMECAACHAMEAAGRAGFASIRRESCASCHREGKVRQDCSLCHYYHRGPGVKAGILAAQPGSAGLRQ